MEAAGTQEEEAARVLGAGGFQTFFRVTLPNIKWGVLYGAILCNARAMGEFSDVRLAGALVKIEVDDDQRTMQVELGRDEYSRIRAIIGERVYVTPRRVRVFMETLPSR